MTYSLRDYAVSLDGMRMTFECGQAGHTYVTDFSRAKPAAPGRLWLSRMLRYWGRAGGGVGAFRNKRGGRTVGRERCCPQCRRAEKTGKK